MKSTLLQQNPSYLNRILWLMIMVGILVIGLVSAFFILLYAAGFLAWFMSAQVASMLAGLLSVVFYGILTLNVFAVTFIPMLTIQQRAKVRAILSAGKIRTLIFTKSIEIYDEAITA